MGDQDLKRRLVDVPKQRALAIDRVPGGRFAVNPNSDDPAVRFGIENRDIEFAVDLGDVLGLLDTSEQFLKMKSALKTKRVSVELEVKHLPPETGGGTTDPPARTQSYLLTFWPPVIPKGYHIIDVVIHEHGHVFEFHGGPDYQSFVNAVQKDIGIRQTPDSHAKNSPQRRRP